MQEKKPKKTGQNCIETRLKVSFEESLQDHVKSKPFGYHVISYNGKTQHLAAWAREFGIKPETLRYRIKKYSAHKAFSVSVRPDTTGFCNAIYPLRLEELPRSIVRGFSIWDAEEELGKIYQFNKIYWTHEFVFQASHPEYSQLWRTRWEAIADLAKHSA